MCSAARSGGAVALLGSDYNPPAARFSTRMAGAAAQSAAVMHESLTISELPIVRAPWSRLQAQPLQEMVRLQRSMGDVASWIDGDEQLWFAFGPHYNRLILSDTDLFHSCFCPIRGPRNSSQRRVTAGLLSMNGDEHRRHRRLLSPPFSRAAMAGYFPGIQARIGETLSAWEVGQTRDVRRDMDRLLLEITSGLLFGVEEPELANGAGTLIEEFLAKNHEVGLAAVSAQVAGSDHYEKLLELAVEVERQIREVIAWRRARPGSGGDLLSLLLQARDEEGGLSDDDLVGHATLLFGAAKSTTAHTLTWTLLLGALHPWELAPVRDELQAAWRHGAPEPHVVAELPRLDAFVQESMRLLPASAYVQRVASRPTQLGPFSLPRGATVVFSQFVSHRMEEQFPEPDYFHTRRWREGRPTPYSYIPFGMGPRLCLGSTLAMTTIKRFLSEAWRRFNLQLPDPVEVDAEVVATMLAPRGALPMRLLPVAQPAEPVRVRGSLAEWLPQFAG